MHAMTMPKRRYLCIYNWSGIRTDRAAIGAMQQVLKHDRDPGPPDK